MESVIPGQFRVKGGRQQVALLHGHRRPIFQRGQNLHSRFHPLNDRSADEDSVEGQVSQDGNRQVGLKTIHLTAESVAPDGDVHQTQDGLTGHPVHNLFRQQNHPGASAPEGPSRTGELPQRLQQSPFLGQKANGSGLPAGDDQSCQALQMLRQADFYWLYAQAGQDMFVLNESTLQGQDADSHSYHPRIASRSSAGIRLMLMPTIGSPRPRLISTRISGSL